jgi:hypothetical protein
VLSISSKYQSILNERPSSSSNLLFDAVLHVSNITKSDYGIYQCKIENALGIDTIEFALTGLSKLFIDLLFEIHLIFLAIPDPPSEIRVVNLSHSSALISWLPGFDGGAQQTFQIRYRLSTADRYDYEHLPFDTQSFDLKNLKLSSEYRLNIRSNNSYHISPWSNELIIKTLNSLPSLSFHLSEFSPKTLSFTVILIIAICGLIIFLINIILIIVFVLKRRRSNIIGENLSTTETNETETNTVDLFQPIPSNFFLINTYQKYEDEDIKKPFVSSFSSINLSPQGKFNSSGSLFLNSCFSF